MGSQPLEAYFQHPEAPSRAGAAEKLDWQIRMGRRRGEQFRRLEQGTLEELLWWIFHPSEHVVLDFLEATFDQGPCRSRTEAQLRLAGYWRGMQALGAGEVWNPLLDRLAHQQAWPTGEQGDLLSQQPGGRVVFESAQRLGWNGPAPNTRLQQPHLQIEKLIPWLRHQAEDTHLQTLLEFDYGELRQLVCQQHPRPDLEWARQIVQHAPETTPNLARNEKLGPGPAQFLMDWAVEHRNLKGLLETGEKVPGWVGTLEALGARGNSMPVSIENELLRLYQTADEPETLTDTMAGWMLTTLPGLSSELLQEIYEETDRDFQREMLRARSSGSEFWHYALRQWDTIAREDAFYLLDQPDARQSPELRKLLLELEDPVFLKALFPHLRGTQERRHGFRQLSRQKGEDALALLEQDPDLAQQLQYEDLTPLLESPQPRLRARALRWLGLKRTDGHDDD